MPTLVMLSGEDSIAAGAQIASMFVLSIIELCSNVQSNVQQYAPHGGDLSAAQVPAHSAPQRHRVSFRNQSSGCPSFIAQVRRFLTGWI